MKKCWKRILAVMLAACVIFCDSSLVYAAESQPIAETSETETDVEVLEIQENLEEETVVEETIVEENVQEEVLPEEELVEEEPEIVEIMPVTEVNTAEQMNSATGNTVLAPGEEVTVTGSDTSYGKNFEFTPTESGKYCLYVKGASKLNIGYIQVYKSDGTMIDSSLQPEWCYDIDADAEGVEDIARGYVLEAYTKYMVNVQGNVKTGDKAIFCIRKVAEEATQLVNGSTAEIVKPGELKIFKVTEDHLQPGTVKWTGEGDAVDYRVWGGASVSWQRSFSNSDRTAGEVALLIPKNQTYYITIKNNSTGTDATILWEHENAEKIKIGDTKDIVKTVNATVGLKFYELELESEKDYLISAHTKEKNYSNWGTKNYNYCEPVLVFNDANIGNYMSYYYDSEEQKSLTYAEEYDVDGVYWLRFKFPKDSPKNIQKIYILGYQTSASYTTQVKVEEIVHPKTLTPNVEAAIQGGSAEEEYDVWYEFIPTEDNYYCFESNDLAVGEVGIWNEEAQMFYTEFPDFFYKFREGASNYLDVQKCYKLEANVRYGIRIWGTVPTNGTSFVWKTTNEGCSPAKLNLGEQKSITGTSIYEISEETTTLGLLSYADYGFGDIGFFGNGNSLIEYQEGTSGTTSFKRNYVVLMPANKKLFITTKALTSSNLTWNSADKIVLSNGYDETIASIEDTIKLYEFTPEKMKSYQVLVQEDVTEIVMIDNDGCFHSAGTEITDEDNNRWIQYSSEELEYIEKVYVIARVKANGSGRVAFKELTSAVDESGINNTLTVDQVVSVSGGESGTNLTKGYTFIPEKSGYYYLKSDSFRDYSYAVYDEVTGYYNYSPNLQVRCVLKDNAETVTDVVTSHFFEEGKTYLIYITGSVAANSSTTFVWTECDETDNAIEVSLNGETFDVPANEISIFKLSSEETTVANIVVTGTNDLRVYGDSYTGLDSDYASGGLQYHERLMPVGKGKPYYYVVKPAADGTISFEEGETKAIQPGDSFEYSLPEGTQSYVVCHEFVPVSGTTYEAHYGTGNTALAIMGKDGNLNWVAEGTITDSEGKEWTEIKALDNYEKIYLFTMIGIRDPQTVALKSDASNVTNMEYNVFTGNIKLEPGGTVIFTYKGPHRGEYFINSVAGVTFEPVSVGEGLESIPKEYYDNYQKVYAYTLAERKAAYASDSVTFTFKLTNTDTKNEKIVSVFNSNERYTWDTPIENEDGTLSYDATLMSNQKDYYASYYKFAIEKTGAYYHPEIAWIVRVKDSDGGDDFTRWDTDVHKVNDNTYTLNAGETYLIKFLSYKSLNDPNTKWSLEPLETSKNWIASMEVQTEKTLLAVGEDLQLDVTTTGEDEEAQVDGTVTYTTSNKAVATVDENGLIKALKEGTATITVTANAGRPDKQIKETVTITVSPKYQIIYYGIGGEGANPGGYLADETPFEFCKVTGVTLVDPIVNDGYEFLGWYSDAKMTKRVTDIAAGTKTNVNLWPKFALKNYNISYGLGYEGKFPADAAVQMSFTIDKDTLIPEPIRLGYKFVGWAAYSYNNDKNIWESFELKTKDGNYYIEAGTKNDVELSALWAFDTTFSLALNSDKVVEVNDNGEEIIKYTITHPYNAVTGKWDYRDYSFVIQSDKEGIVAETNYYDEENPIVKVELYKANLDGTRDESSRIAWNSNDDRYNENDYYYDSYAVTDILGEYIEEPGKYFLYVSYTYPYEMAETQELSLEFNVEYEKREYPVKKEVNWSAISTLESDLSYGTIASEIVEMMQPEENAFVEGLESKELLEPIKVTFKNSKNKAVKDTAKVTSGTYTVTLQFADNARFLDEATATVNITYGTVTNAGVQYLASENGQEQDSAGRTAGSTIAFSVTEVDGDGTINNINATPYVSEVRIDPMVKVPWSDEAIPAAELEQALNENGYPDYQVKVRIKNTSIKPFLKFTDVKKQDAVVAYSVSGNAAGKTNLVFETVITKTESDGTETETLIIPTTIKNFTVVNGGVDAVKELTVHLFSNIEEKAEGPDKYPGKYLVEEDKEDADGVKIYLLKKSDNAKTYWLKADAENYEELDLVNPKLTWKSGNSKLAAVKTAKDGTTTLTIPKNAQGVVDITVTANDAGKNSQSIKLVIVDTSMRLDTTSLTMNSKLEGESEVAYLYPNVLASQVKKEDDNEVSVESIFSDTIEVNGESVKRIALYKKVGKSGYEKSDIFDTSYDLSTGELLITFNSDNYPVKAATHTLYVGILHNEDIVTDESGNQTVGVPKEMYALKIKDTCAVPKAPTLKATKNYETAYKNGWAEFTIKLNAEPQYFRGNPTIQTTDTTKFEVVEWKEIDDNQWKLKVIANDSETLSLTAKQTSKVIKGVEFAVAYEDYRADVIQTVKTNLTVTKTVPKLYTYGEDAYAPVYYTDADYRFVDVVIPVTKEIIDGLVADDAVEMTLNDDSTGAYLEVGDKKLDVTLTDTEKFKVVSAEYYSDYDDSIPAKKGYMSIEQAVKLTVYVEDSQTKAANLQLRVESSGLSDGLIITTQKLTINPRKLASESISLYDWYTNNAAKSITFNSNYAGKESAFIHAGISETLESISEANDFYGDKHILVEAADKNTEKMLQNNELLLNADEYSEMFEITSTSGSFKYKSAKLKVTYQTESGIKTKSAVMTVNFKKALTPKITVNNAKLIRGLAGNNIGTENEMYWGSYVYTTVKYANMPTGAEVVNIRYADQSDYTKYDAPKYYGYLPTKLHIKPKAEASLSNGKDVIDLIYDVRTVTGDMIQIPAKITVTITDSISFKVDVKTMNLYNSAEGTQYGKYATFYDAKGHAVEVTEIVNAEELKKAGIGFDLVAENETDRIVEQNLEEQGADAVKFYVDHELSRGIEKTYTVKAKVAIVNSAERDPFDTWKTTTAAEKVLTFKIVLKK